MSRFEPHTVIILDQNPASAAGLAALVAAEGFRSIVIRPKAHADSWSFLKDEKNWPLACIIDSDALRIPDVRRSLSQIDKRHRRNLFPVLIARHLGELAYAVPNAVIFDKPLEPTRIIEWLRSLPGPRQGQFEH